MPRRVETQIWWKRDLVDVESTCFWGQPVTQGTWSEGPLTKVVRVVSGPSARMPSPAGDFGFLRILVLAAMAHVAFLVMFAVTPMDTPVFAEELVPYDARNGTLLLGAGRATQTLAQAPVAGADRRIVIPTPVGSRVRPVVLDAPLPMARLKVKRIGSVGLLASIGTSIESTAVLDAVVEDRIDVDGEEGLGGFGFRGIGAGGGGTATGVIGGTIATASLSGALEVVSSRRGRCRRIAARLEDPTLARWVRRACRRASSEAVACWDELTREEAVTMQKLQACRRGASL